MIFLNTEMGAHIEPAGWREWHPEKPLHGDGELRRVHNTGPGAHPTEREPHTKKLTPAEAARYDTRRFLAGTDGWDPTARRP